MSDKPQWLAVAMEEIERQYAAWDKGCLDTIEAIIKEHCPEDKGVGKLVDIAKRLIAHKSEVTEKFRIYKDGFSWGWVLSTIEEAESALAEYEANK